MGTAALQWEGSQFLFLMNRDKWDVLEAERVISTTDGIDTAYEGKNEMWGGSWFGFKNGRFAFVLDSSDSEYSSTLVRRFLMSTNTPFKFAEDLAQNEAASFGSTLHLVVADCRRNHSMLYISKMAGDETRLRIVPVTQDFHTVSVNGFDSDQDEDLRTNLTQLINNDIEEKLTIEDITRNLMTKEPYYKELTNFFRNVKVPHTNHTVGLKVRPHPTEPRFFQWTAPAIATLEYYP